MPSRSALITAIRHGVLKVSKTTPTSDITLSVLEELEKLIGPQDPDLAIYDLLAAAIRPVLEGDESLTPAARVRLLGGVTGAVGGTVERIINEEVEHATKRMEPGLEPVHMLTVVNMGSLLSWSPVCHETEPWRGTFDSSYVTCPRCRSVERPEG